MPVTLEAYRPRLIHSVEPAQAEVLDFISPAAWHGKPVPERDWGIDGIAAAGQVVNLSGDGGLGKTILALQAMVAVQLGRPWLGHAVKQGNVLGLFCEDDLPELWRRLARIAEREGATLADLREMRLLSMVGRDAVLLEESNGRLRPTRLFDSLAAAIRERKPALTVLDSLYDFFSGSEINRGIARQAVAHLRSLVLEHNGVLLFSSHPSVAGMANGSGQSGSTAWNAAVRSRLYLTKPGGDGDQDDTDRVLKIMKSNYGPAGQELPLRWADGAFEVREGAGGVVGAINQRNAERVFLSGLYSALARGIYPSIHEAGGPVYAPALIAKSPEGEGYRKDALKRAMQSLIADGRIVIRKTPGRTSRQRDFIAPADWEPTT